MRSVIGQVAGVLIENRVAVAHATLVRNQPQELGTQVGRDRHDRSLDGLVRT
jgi:hypothetical protein